MNYPLLLAIVSNVILAMLAGYLSCAAVFGKMNNAYDYKWFKYGAAILLFICGVLSVVIYYMKGN